MRRDGRGLAVTADDGSVWRAGQVVAAAGSWARLMGVDEPDYGHLLSDMEVSSASPVEAGRYCYPRVEVEVGFVLGATLPGEGCTEEDVLDATEAVAPAIELIDSRIRDWRIGLVDTIADNASSAGFDRSSISTACRSETQRWRHSRS